ncbi:Ankycorbin [Dissostichus eleginoides]|uniref:Ankycorbin n=1 Tax=Dissostichus eleginoides TaxID=100907 RepID=A0AAD9EWJ3_DISEL|nr:Ankycorbin [Dissostichus eleginoides]
MGDISPYSDCLMIYSANEWNKNDERLLAAVEHGEAEKVAPLLAKKGASSVKLDSEGKSALHVAAARGHTDCLSVILAHGADLSITDAAGLNPLHLAAKNNHIECCKKLIQSKCPIDAVDSSGKAALHHAAASGNIQTVQLLCELKTPVNLKDADGLTPLLLSAKHAHAEVCSTLVDCGAEVNTFDNSGRTALMLATESGALSVVEVLIQRRADLTAADSQGHDVLHYAKLSGNSEIKTLLTAALNSHQGLDTKSPRSPQHDQVAKLSDERITTPKKRKAPPPPISPLQSSGPSSPSVLTSSGTPGSNKSDTPKRFNYKEDEVRGTTLRAEVEKLHEERTMLLETIEDLKQSVEQTGPDTETKVEQSFTASSALVSALQAKIAALTLEKQQLASKLKKYPSLQGSEDTSRPNSMTSNSSFHSTQDEFESPPHVEREEEENGGGSKEEIQLLRQALESVQVKLLETRKENRLLHTQLKPEREGEEDETRREKGREEELMESLAELQAKLTDTQERYHQAVEEVEELREHMGREGGETDQQEVQRRTLSTLEQEVKQLRALLVQSGSELELAAQRSRQLEEALRSVKEGGERTVRIEELHKEAQEEIRILQEALRGTVPVEAAAKDFEEMKVELSEVNAGLQRRLLELSHSYSDTKSQLSAAQKQLSEGSAPSSPSSEQQQVTVLISKVMSSLGNAIKELESQSEALKEQLQQKILQVEDLQKRLSAAKDGTQEDSASRMEQESRREQLEGEVKHLTQLLQGALRKQDEMALEAADAWQMARDNRAELEALQELLMSREKENQVLTSRLAEAQDAVCQLKQLVENHVASEREKNKRIDDLSREVGKLKDALNSLSQLSYSAGSPLQYQLTESKKQHQEIVSVYRMHLLYAVQGQMDEDVQKALKQILMMCKMPSPAKETC